MPPELEFLSRALMIGIGATAVMDLWAVFLNRCFGAPLAQLRHGGQVGRPFGTRPLHP